jgi:hypothetical protein
MPRLHCGGCPTEVKGPAPSGARGSHRPSVRPRSIAWSERPKGQFSSAGRFWRQSPGPSTRARIPGPAGGFFAASAATSPSAAPVNGILEPVAAGHAGRTSVAVGVHPACLRADRDHPVQPLSEGCTPDEQGFLP